MIKAKSVRIEEVTRLGDNKKEIRLEVKDKHTEYVGQIILTESQLRTLRNDINKILND